MLSILGHRGRLCDAPTRREFLQVGGASLLGLSLPQVLALEARADQVPTPMPGNGFGRAKSVIFLFLQGGPSHIDIWDPKPDAPDNVRGPFKPIHSNVAGTYLAEPMPLLAQQMDKCTLIRSVSYTPNGLFNHTAAMYQMLTGYTTDRVSPSGQLEPPSPSDFPNIACQVARIRPPDVPMFGCVMLPRPPQESNVINKGGTAGFLGKAYDPYYLFQDPNQEIKLDDLTLRAEISPSRLEKRASLRQTIAEGWPELQRAVEPLGVDKYYENAFDLILSGRARNAFDLSQEPDKVRERYGRHTFGQSVLLARRLIEAGTRFVEVNWPSVANGDPTMTAWDCHAALLRPMRDLHCPKLDSALSALLDDLASRGMLQETLVLAIGEFGRSPRMGVSTSGNSNAPDGRDHWPYCYTALMAGGGIPGGRVFGQSDGTASSPTDFPVHPTQLLATLYHALGIDPGTIVYNHLGQPRELVQAKPVLSLF